MRRLYVLILAILNLSGCAIVKTTDVTDAAFKRHQSVSVLGWPVYTRITDQDRGASSPWASTEEVRGAESRVRAAEMLGGPYRIDP